MIADIEDLLRSIRESERIRKQICKKMLQFTFCFTFFLLPFLRAAENELDGSRSLREAFMYREIECRTATLQLTSFIVFKCQLVYRVLWAIRENVLWTVLTNRHACPFAQQISLVCGKFSGEFCFARPWGKNLSFFFLPRETNNQRVRTIWASSLPRKINRSIKTQGFFHLIHFIMYVARNRINSYRLSLARTTPNALSLLWHPPFFYSELA